MSYIYFCINHILIITLNNNINSFYGVAYIFTEYFYDSFLTYINVTKLLNTVLAFVLYSISYTLPYIVKYTIGYCHFYYQLGYGLIFYIYFYRRYKAKKTNNWATFYGNSISNWLLFNISLFNKFIFNRNFLIYVKTLVYKSLLIINFWYTQFCKNNLTYNKWINVYKSIINNNNLVTWTPIFKRTSYISFLTALKRFNKRK